MYIKKKSWILKYNIYVALISLVFYYCYGFKLLHQGYYTFIYIILFTPVSKYVSS